MAKAKARSSTPKKKPNGKAGKARAGKTSHRLTTFKANGGIPESVAVPAEPPTTIPIDEAMKTAIEALGPVTIDKSLAPSQLAQLSDAYEEVVRAKTVFTAKSDAAKVAKKSLEAAEEVLLDLVKTFTHSAPLPLFDQVEREQDQENMLDGGDVDNEQEQSDGIAF